MAVAGAEVAERHLEGAADLGVHVVHLAGEAIRRQPFGDGVGFEEGPVNAFGGGAQDAVELDGSGSHGAFACQSGGCRSEEHTSELQSLMRISYAVFCLKKKK